MHVSVSIVETKHIWIKHILMQDVAYYSYKNTNNSHTCHPEMSGAKINKYKEPDLYVISKIIKEKRFYSRNFFYFQSNSSIFMHQMDLD